MLAPHAPPPDAASPGGKQQKRGALSPSKSLSEGLVSTSGKTDLLLRFFGSSHFNEWIAVHYLWRARSEVRARPVRVAAGRPRTEHTTTGTPPQGVRDYLCNRMYSLDERLLEAHLGQLVTLAVTQPSPSLERLLGDLCRRSPRVACKVRLNPCPRRRLARLRLSSPRAGDTCARALRGAVAAGADQRSRTQVSWLLHALPAHGKADHVTAASSLVAKCDAARAHGA